MNGTVPVGSPVSDDFVPMRPNYRTNIYGALLTTGVVYDVTIDPNWGGAWNNGEFVTWDGTTKTAVTIPASPAPITLDTPAQLAWLADYVDQGHDLKGYTVTLSHNFDLGGAEWTAIGNLKEKPFRGTLDGNFHPVKGLKATSGTKDAPAALIGWLEGEVRNLAIEDAEVSGVVAAGLVGQTQAASVITNCQILSGTVSGSTNAGGLVARAYQPVTMTQCTNAATVSGTSVDAKVGGLVSIVSNPGSSKFTDCANSGAVTGYAFAGGIICTYSLGTVQDCSNSAAVTATSTAAKQGAAGGVAASMASSAKLKNCAGGQAAVTAKYAGRLVGSGDNSDRSNPVQPCIWIASNADAYASLPTIGVMNLLGSGNNNGVYTIMSGTLHGNTPVINYGTAAGGNATYKIVMEAGTVWTLFPNAATTAARTYAWDNASSAWAQAN